MSKKRQAWILNYMTQHGDVSIVDQNFVTSYIDAFRNEIKFAIQPFGTDTVPDLSRQLSVLYTQGSLTRTRWSAGEKLNGFPSWWYVYFLPE